MYSKSIVNKSGCKKSFNKARTPNKQEENSKQEWKMSTLPSVIVEDILCRLPVKSLKRFRCVAKSWCLLIDSECFIKLHLRRSQVTNSNRNLILGGLGLYSIDLDSLDKAQTIRPPFYYESVDSITNSCNGLVVVMSEPPVLWNPFSRNYKILPDSAVENPIEPESYSKTAYGFGYDSTNDDYKVVKVVEFRNKISHVWMCSETKIYSTKSKSWKRIEGFPYSLPFLRGHWRVHVNGALYTLVEDPNHIHSGGFLKIMAFSVETEKHFEEPMPPGIRLRDVSVNLDVIGGCLSVVCSSMSKVIIWVMQEYGVKESWTTLLSIKSPSIDPHDCMKPLVYTRDGDKILLNCADKRLALYDLRNKTVENVIVDGLPFVFYAEVCVESLVSFDAPDEVKKHGAQKKMAKSSSSKSDDFLSEGFKLVL